MFGISFGKLVVLIAVLAAVWYGFKYIGRLQRIERGERRPSERSMGERLRKAARGKGEGKSDTGQVEDTEACPVCNAYVSVDAVSNCGRPNCPY